MISCERRNHGLRHIKGSAERKIIDSSKTEYRVTTISLQTSGSVIRTTVNVRISCACFDATSKTQLNNTFHIITLQVLVFGKSLHGPSSRHAYGPLKEARVYSENNTIDDTPYENMTYCNEIKKIQLTTENQIPRVAALRRNNLRDKF